MMDHAQDRSVAIAPVVGVLLLLGITILLAVTTGLFVTTMESPGQQPLTAIYFDVSLEEGGSDALTIAHEGGSALSVGDATVIVEGASATGGTPNGEYSLESVSSLAADEQVTASTTFRLDASDFDGVSAIAFDSATVTIRKTDPNGRSVTVLEWTGSGG